MKKPLLTTVTAAAIALTIVIPLHVLNPSVVQADVQQGKPDYKNRDEIPAKYKWNLDDMYKSKTSWEADVKKAENLSAEFKNKYQGKLAKSAAELSNALKDYALLSAVSERVYVYAHLSFDVSQSNSSLQALTNRAEKMTAAVSANTAWFQPEIVKLPTVTIEGFLRNKMMTPYHYFVRDMIRTKAHTLSKEEEELIAKLSPLTDTGSNVYAMLAKDVKFPMIENSDGKKVSLNRTNFISYMESKDRNVRKLAYETYYQTLEKFQDSFSQSLAAQVKGHNIGAEVRHYPSALDAAITSNNLPSKVYDQLIASVNKGLPLMHRYMELKKKLLGVNELHMYDMYTPIVAANHTYISFENAKNMILEGLKPLGKDYIAILKQAFDNRWIDVYSTDDKATGAYQWGSYDKHPYLLLNYQGTKDDVSTIAHELGHAVNSYLSDKKQNYLNSSYATFTAEVASTLNESLIWNSEYKNAKTKSEKMYLLNQRLENFRTTLFRQTQFAEFEKKIHELDQKGEPLNAETFKKMYGDINRKYYGKVMKTDGEIPMEWARIPHFYNHNFYVYQYATSFAASAALSKQITEEGTPAVNRVKGFLSAGGSTDPISILKGAGVDLSTSKPIDQAMEVFKDTLDEMEKLVNEK